MRLLIVTDKKFPCDEPFLREVYARRWEKFGDVVFVMETSEGIDSGLKKWEGHQVYTVSNKMYNHLRSLKRFVGNQNALKPIIEDEGPFDIIQVRNELGLGLDAVDISDKYNIPFVYRLSHLKSETLQLGYQQGLPSYSISDYVKGALGKRVRQLLADQSDAILTISDAMSSHLVEQGYQSQVKAMPMAADTTLDPKSIDPEPFRSEWDLEDTPYLVYIGTMNPIRQLEFLFPLIKTVREDGCADIRLVLVGGRKKSNQYRLRKSAQKSGVDDVVTFTGWVSKDRLQQAVVGAEIGLSPIPENCVLRTNSPTKVMEYLNLSTPVVATSTPEQERVVSESGAGMLASRETAEFANAICCLMGEDEYRRKLGQQGRKYIKEKRSYDDIAKELNHYYKKICQDHD